MNKGNRKIRGSVANHPSDDELLRFIDGEQPAEFAENVAGHLKACWDCRVRAEKMNFAITSFVDFRGMAIKSVIKVPDNRGNFRRRLGDAIAEAGAELSLFGRLWQQLVKPFAAIKKSAILLGRQFAYFVGDQRRRRLLTTATATIVLISFLFAFLIWSPNLVVVSAEEFLDRAVSAYQTRIVGKEKPVVHCQVRIERRSARGDNSFDVDLWRDETNSRNRQIVNADVAKIISGLAAVLKDSGYVPDQPLSVAGFRAWRGSLSNKSDEIERAADNGVETLRLTTRNQSPPINRLISSSLTVRTSDFYPIEQAFVIGTDGGDEQYIVREMSFSVLDLTTVGPDFFNDPSMVVATTPPTNEKVEPSPQVSRSTVGMPEFGTSETDTARSVATPELEVEVFELLHQAGADLGEQVNVSREPNGPIRVTGIVDSRARKEQILNYLTPVSGNPAVSIDVQTVGEASARQRMSKSKNPPTVQMETREVEVAAFPAEPAVKKHFVGQSDEIIRQYAIRVINQSSEAMRYLYALQRLKKQMKADDFARLPGAAQSKYVGLVRSYATSYANEIGALRRELLPVFGAGSNAEETAIDNIPDMFAAIDRLLSIGTAGDRAVNAAFSAGRASGQVQSSEFLKDLASAESIALGLRRIK